MSFAYQEIDKDLSYPFSMQGGYAPPPYHSDPFLVVPHTREGSKHTQNLSFVITNQTSEIGFRSKLFFYGIWQATKVRRVSDFLLRFRRNIGCNITLYEIGWILITKTKSNDPNSENLLRVSIFILKTFFIYCPIWNCVWPILSGHGIRKLFWGPLI